MSGSSSPQTSTTEVKVPAFQQPFLEDVFNTARTQFQAGAPNITGSTEQTAQAGQQAQQTAGDILPFLQQAQQANQFLLGDVLSPGTNPALQEYIRLSNEAIGRDFNQTVLPQITSSAVASGNIGSSRQGVAEGLAAQGLQDVIAQNTAGLTSQGYLAGLNALTQGVNQAPAIAASSAIPLELLTQGAQLTRAAETADFDLMNQLLNNYANIVTRGFGNTTTTTQPGPSSGGFAGAIGGGLPGLALYANPATAPFAPFVAGAGALAGSGIL